MKKFLNLGFQPLANSYIKKKIENKIDLFDRGEKYQAVEIDNTFPEYLRNNLEKYKKFTTK